MTVPAIPSTKFHRYDEIKEAMMLPDPSEAVASDLSRMAAVLRAGGRVWLIGSAPAIIDGSTPMALPTAPQSPFGWISDAYDEMWSENIGYFLQTHALDASIVELPDEGPVSPYENPPLVVVSGWRK